MSPGSLPLYPPKPQYLNPSYKQSLPNHGAGLYPTMFHENHGSLMRSKSFYHHRDNLDGMHTGTFCHYEGPRTDEFGNSLQSFDEHTVSSEEDNCSNNNFANGNNHITKPGQHDVLCGRGGGTNNHPGNVKFREVVSQYKMKYLTLSKGHKPKVAREVVDVWRRMDPPGRFLARKSIGRGSFVWYEIGDQRAREKASQCLRERTPDVLPFVKHLREEKRKKVKGVGQGEEQEKNKKDDSEDSTERTEDCTEASDDSDELVESPRSNEGQPKQEGEKKPKDGQGENIPKEVEAGKGPEAKNVAEKPDSHETEPDDKTPDANPKKSKRPYTRRNNSMKGPAKAPKMPTLSSRHSNPTTESSEAPHMPALSSDSSKCTDSKLRKVSLCLAPRQAFYEAVPELPCRGEANDGSEATTVSLLPRKEQDDDYFESTGQNFSSDLRDLTELEYELKLRKMQEQILIQEMELKQIRLQQLAIVQEQSMHELTESDDSENIHNSGDSYQQDPDDYLIGENFYTPPKHITPHKDHEPSRKKRGQDDVKMSLEEYRVQLESFITDSSIPRQTEIFLNDGDISDEDLSDLEDDELGEDEYVKHHHKSSRVAHGFPESDPFVLTRSESDYSLSSLRSGNSHASLLPTMGDDGVSFSDTFFAHRMLSGAQSISSCPSISSHMTELSQSIDLLSLHGTDHLLHFK